MKTLSQHILEKLVINKNTKMGYKYHPSTFDELRQIIQDRYKELGPGTAEAPIDFNDVDVSEITSFYNNVTKRGIFENIKFKYIDIANWNVSNVEDMHNLFRCTILRSVGYLSNWDVSRVKDMHSMFYECSKLESIGDLSNWDVSNVENMNCMFTRCEKLESIGDLSNWNISNVNDIRWIFTDCKQLKSVGDILNWNVSHIKDMSGMFFRSGITNIPNWYKE